MLTEDKKVHIEDTPHDHNRQAVQDAQAPKQELSGTLTITSPDKKFNENPLIVLLGSIVIPAVIALVGWQFTVTQTEIARNRQLYDIENSNKRQDADSADKAIETRESVLTDFSKSISELVTNHDLRKPDPQAQDLARGQALIALRRLNVPDHEAKGNKGDKGELKGLLIRYLYDAELIFHDPSLAKPPIVSLGGADITKVVLKDAWLKKINLKGTWLNGGDFGNAFLAEANLSEAKLIKTNFTGATLNGADLHSANLNDADLRFAKLTDAKLDGAKLSGACYVEGTEAQLFPEGFDPAKAGMKAMPQEKSDPSKPDAFEPCVKP